jgi:hypothetical protein
MLISEADKAEAAFNYFEATLALSSLKVSLLISVSWGFHIWTWQSLVVLLLRRRFGRPSGTSP